MQGPPQLFISIVRMHHIVNQTKFRKLKQHAIDSGISGLVKTGRPGVLVFEAQKESISTFLEGARGLRYLDFHHVDTQPLPSGTHQLLAESKIGLHEVLGMRELVDALDLIGMKSWFRRQMGMTKDD